MARYIDADKVMEEIARIGGHNLCEWETIGVKALIDRQPTADVVPKSEEGAECPTCHGTGRIGTTDWLTKNISKKQLAEEKAKAIAEHEQHIKSEVAREIFEEIEREINDAAQSNYKVLPLIEESEALWNRVNGKIDALRGIGGFIDELKEKYTED